MKKRIQNYLSGNNEGFSLIELIIVIAIMAILVGVVALAVIPNLEKSRESKDLATLDTVCSGLGVAVANAGSKANSTDSFEVQSITNSADPDTVKAGLFDQLGNCASMKLGCKILSGQSIMCEYNLASNLVAAYPADGSAQSAKYAKDADGNASIFLVTNVGK